MDKVRLVAKALVDVRYLTTEQFAAAHSVCEGVGDDHAQGEKGGEEVGVERWTTPRNFRKMASAAGIYVDRHAGDEAIWKYM